MKSERKSKKRTKKREKREREIKPLMEKKELNWLLMFDKVDTKKRWFEIC